MSTSVDHVGINVTNFEQARKFYVAALKPLGLQILQDYGTVVGFGADYPFLWVGEGSPGHVHLALRADTPAMVDAFYKAALGAGGKDNGAPGIRSEYSENYYAAFVLDADGHNIEAVCHVRR
ncbi:MAG TPA: VOC family protein [Devosia sp.]|nr:VOC family protein [Devosia sp.]